MDKKVLYQIKTLDKLIFRSLICDSDTSNYDLFKIKMPTQTQMQIIAYILKNPNKEVYQKELEEVLNLRRATVSGVLHTMETNNLITRVTDLEDTRTKKIKLNSKAEDIFNKNRQKLDEMEEVIKKDITKEELDTFLNVLEKMKENIKEMSTNSNN